MKLKESALKILKQRYFHDGEDWEQLCNRVVENVMQGCIEKHKHDMKILMMRCVFLPNTPTLANAGRAGHSLPACYVLPIEDSMEGIFETVKKSALIMKSGGGIGIDFSPLREKGAIVKSTGGQSSGVISFMNVFNQATESVHQGGLRRGAEMASLRVDHPEIEDFVMCKDDTTKLTNCNTSVMITDDFMTAVKEQRGMFNLVSPVDGSVVKAVDPVALFDKIVYQAWKTGEPGLVFIDRIKKFNPTPNKEITSVNACSEQPLLPFESCVLGSIDISKIDDCGYTLDDIVRLSVLFLDCVIDANHYIFPEIENATKSTRKIGLGIMGVADRLYMKGLPYNSKGARDHVGAIMKRVNESAIRSSINLASVKGHYPEFNESCMTRALDMFSGVDLGEQTMKMFREHGIRNASVTTVAPTGSISIIAGCSSGIEPNFALSYHRRTDTGLEWRDHNKYFEKALNDYGSPEKVREDDILAVEDPHPIWMPKEIMDVFVTAQDIHYEDHVLMQAEVQKHVMAGISKTINMQNDATVEDVEKAYMLAYDSGCKGITVYRDGSRSNQVLSVTKKDKPTVPTLNEQKHKTHEPRTRPVVTEGTTTKIPTACGNLYVTVNHDGEGECEVFARMGKGGNCVSAQLEAMSRLISLCLRADVSAKSVVKQLKGIKCSEMVWHNGEKICSCGDGIARVIAVQMSNTNSNTNHEVGKSLCPECGQSIQMTEGCMKCLACGWSKC